MAPEENDKPVAVAPGPVEVIEPGAAHRVQVIGKDDYRREYVQKPLSFFGKLDFFAVMGKALNNAMGGEDGVSLSDLLDVPERGETASARDMADADVFVRGIAKLAIYAPEILKEFYCVALGVPRPERASVSYIMELPEDEGGLNDEDGFAIIETFVDQNAEVLTDFFKNRLGKVVGKVGQAMNSGSES